MSRACGILMMAEREEGKLLSCRAEVEMVALFGCWSQEGRVLAASFMGPLVSCPIKAVAIHVMFIAIVR